MKTVFQAGFRKRDFYRFVLPAVISMIFVSLYTIIDGMFVSALVGSDALAAINILFPILNVMLGVSIMLATGASAIIAIQMGQGKLQDARKNFTFTVVATLVASLVILVLGLSFLEPLLQFLGATPRTYEYAYVYTTIMLLGGPAMMLKILFEYLLRVDGFPRFGMIISIAGGIINIVLDYIFIAIFHWGIAGAAIATIIGYLLPLLCALLHFLFSKVATLRFVRFRYSWQFLRDAMLNGSSEMVTELSSGITTLLFNIIALHYAGEDGVAAITIVLYAHFLMVSTYLGFSAGTAPLISYYYGAKEFGLLRNLLATCKQFVLGSSVLIFLLAELLAAPMVSIFVEQGSNVYNLALFGMRIFSVCFLFIGANVFTSGMFTAYSNGKISAIISFGRTFGFEVLALLLLPFFLGFDGVWLAVPIAEFLTLGITLFYLRKYRTIYNY